MIPPIQPGTLDSPTRELVKRVPRAVTPGENERAFIVMLVGLPTFCFLLSFLWVLFHA